MEEEKDPSQYRYSSGNTPTQGNRLITHPASESSTSGDEGFTETYDTKGPFDEHGYEEMDSLKKMKNSTGLDESKCCEIVKTKTEGNTSRTSDSEDSTSSENPDWHKIDSLTETESPEANDKSHDLFPVHHSSVSVDAMSFNEDMVHTQGVLRHQELLQVTRDCLKSRDKLKDYFSSKQTPIANNAHKVYQNNPSSVTFYDAIVVYAKEDFNEVIDFTHNLQAIMNYEAQHVPEIELYDHGMFCSSTVRGVEDVMNRASVVFIYLTRNLNSEIVSLFIDEAVSLSRLDMNHAYVMPGRRTTDRKWAVKPVQTLPASTRNYKIPAGLVSSRGINWYDKDSQHTRSTIVSIMKEARRIREEADRREVANTFQTQFQIPRNSQPLYAPTKEKLRSEEVPSIQKSVKTHNSGFSITGTGRGDIRVRFRPSVRPTHPPVSYHSPGPPVNQPLYYQTSQQLYVRPSISSRINMDPGVQNQPAVYHTRYPVSPGHRLPPPIKTQVYPDYISGGQDSISLYQAQAPVTPGTGYGNTDTDNRQSFESAQTSQSESKNMGFQERHEVRNSPRRQRSDKSNRSKFDRSASETSSSDESDDFEGGMPASMKKKRNINIIGCKFVQLGAGNKVYDGPAVSKKKKAKSSRRVKHDDSDEAEPVGSESKSTAKLETERNESRQDLDQNAPLVSEPHQVHSAAQTSQNFNSSVTEDNLDISNSDVPYRSSKQSVSEKGKLFKDKDLSFSDLKESETKVVNTVKVTANKKTFASRDAVNVKLKSSGELKEYQLTANGKTKDVFVNDLDEADDQNVLGESGTEQNINCDSSGDDNNAFSDDLTDSEKESLTKELLQKQTNNKERSAGKKYESHQKPVQVVRPLPKPPQSMDFMSMIDTLKIISTKSAAYTKPTSVLSQDEVE